MNIKATDTEIRPKQKPKFRPITNGSVQFFSQKCVLCQGYFRKVQILFKKSGHPIFVGPRLKKISNRCMLQSVIQVREILFDILQLDKKCRRSLHLTQKQREKSTSEHF